MQNPLTKRIKNQWPKIPPALSAEQNIAREKWMNFWHERLENKHQFLERFNHEFLTKLDLPSPCKTLEVGAGLGGHLPWEDLTRQDYYCLEYRKEWADRLATKYRSDRVLCGDIQSQLSFADGFFDRVVAIHVLEHLPDLPRALQEISRLLKSGGILDVTLPCEGGWAYHWARELVTARLFKKNFKMDYAPIMSVEHVSDYDEILNCLKEYGFSVEKSSYFPMMLPWWKMNVCVGLRLRKSNH